MDRSSVIPYAYLAPRAFGCYGLRAHPQAGARRKRQSEAYRIGQREHTLNASQASLRLPTGRACKTCIHGGRRGLAA
eukprot:6212600-Pleurochrysis_carterae.AAC.2